MKVSGFTIVRNGDLFAYPFKEAILSVLPLCDEFIVNVGISNDNTLDIVKSIKDDKIKIFESDWDMSLKGGTVLSVETNKALKECTGNWCFYIQSDEVLHEKYHKIVSDAMSKYFKDEKTEGLRFRYRHFYGSYDYYQDNYRKWYIKESRIIKNSENIISWGDAMDFRHKDGSKLKVRDVKAEIYHYGWVRPPEKLLHKRKEFERLYNEGEEVEKKISGFRNYDDLGNLKRFSDAHPKVMQERISKSNWDFDAKLDEQKHELIRKIRIFLDPLIKRL